MPAVVAAAGAYERPAAAFRGRPSCWERRRQERSALRVGAVALRRLEPWRLGLKKKVSPTLPALAARAKVVAGAAGRVVAVAAEPQPAAVAVLQVALRT